MKKVTCHKIAAVIIILGLVGCTYIALEGQWIKIGAPSVYFKGVRFIQNAAIAEGYEAVCNEARDDIEQQVISGLPKRLTPITFHGPETAETDDEKALLQVQVARCDVDSYQWDVGGSEPIFSFYMTLFIHVTLKVKDELVLDQIFVTTEQVHTDVPTPIFEFDHQEPVVHILAFFDRGKVWTPKTGKPRPASIRRTLGTLLHTLQNYSNGISRMSLIM